LRERFAEGKPWEDTLYYKNMDIISNSEKPSLASKTSNGNVISQAEPRKEFVEYLSHLDGVYESTKHEGTTILP